MGRKKKEYRFAAIDAETDPFDGLTNVKPFIWGFYDGVEYLQFDTQLQLVNFLRDKDYIVYAHNGGKFDYHFMLDLIDEFQEIMIISGRIAKFKIGECEFRDSYNIIPLPLSAWEKDDFDYSILHKDYRDIPENRAKIEEYLKHDCVYLFEMITAFIEEFGLNLTLAGTSLKTWQEMSGIDAPKSDIGHYDFFSPYYYGGRVECFQTGFKKLDFEMIDINSAYPDKMCDKHPLTTDFYEENDLSLKELNKLLKTDEGKAGFFHIEAQASGCFPYRAPDGGLYFPNDEKVRKYFVSGWELLAALETKTCNLIQTYSAYIFQELVSFNDYIMHFYKKRKKAKAEGDKAGDIFSKLLMNSLYGKFAAHPENYQKYMNVPPECAGAIGQDMSEELEEIFEDDEKAIKNYDLSAWHQSGELGPWALAARPLDSFEQTYYNIATSASITGAVRAFMWRTICECEGLIYCDTDSIAATGFSKKIKMSKELGDWDKEGEFKDFSIAGKKMYAFKYAPEYIKQNPKTGELMTHKVASKGVRLNAEQIKRAAKGETVLFEPQAPTYSIHKEPTFVSRRVRRTSKDLLEVEENAIIKRDQQIVKNMKKTLNSI